MWNHLTLFQIDLQSLVLHPSHGGEDYTGANQTYNEEPLKKKTTNP